jgi:hypothetical protein
MIEQFVRHDIRVQSRSRGRRGLETMNGDTGRRHGKANRKHPNIRSTVQNDILGLGRIKPRRQIRIDDELLVKQKLRLILGGMVNAVPASQRKWR